MAAPGLRLPWRALGLLGLAALGCDEDPIRLEDRLWLVEQESQSLRSISLTDSTCQVRGYLTDQLGPIALDREERLLAVDILQRRLVELQPSDGQITLVTALPQLRGPRALTISPGGRFYVLDEGTRVLQVDPESGSWAQAWTLQPASDWRGLAWLPEAVVGSSGQLVPAGTLLVWRPSGARGELAWLELDAEVALAHSLLSTPALAAIETSAGLERIYGLSEEGEIYHLRPEIQDCVWLRQAGCAPLLVTDIALP